MSTGFSPNDPVFWLNHANVDRLWANWQARRLADVPGSTPEDHYPPPTDMSPLDGDPAPLGHRLDDQMWPWAGGAPGFDVEIDSAVKRLLPDLSAAPAVSVREMLQTETVDPVSTSPSIRNEAAVGDWPAVSGQVSRTSRLVRQVGLV